LHQVARIIGRQFDKRDQRRPLEQQLGYREHLRREIFVLSKIISSRLMFETVGAHEQYVAIGAVVVRDLKQEFY
jgi:hypothetical protein